MSIFDFDTLYQIKMAEIFEVPLLLVCLVVELKADQQARRVNNRKFNLHEGCLATASFSRGLTLLLRILRIRFPETTNHVP